MGPFRVLTPPKFRGGDFFSNTHWNTSFIRHQNVFHLDLRSNFGIPPTEFLKRGIFAHFLVFFGGPRGGPRGGRV